MSAVRPSYRAVDDVPVAGVIGVVAFGSPAPESRGLRVEVPIPQIGGPVAEVWTTDGDVVRGHHGAVEFARTDDVLFGTVRVEGRRADDAAASAYDSIVAACRTQGLPHLWRVWNHVGGINEDEEGLERYKRFSVGRHESLTRHGYARDRFPAASAVGMSAPGLLIYFLAGRVEGKQTENPRQVSAYDYPPQYGPRSPSFSRATVVGDDLIFVSGTASVVGHESHHHESAEKQLDETVQNLDVTLGAAASLVGRSATTGELSVAKIYVRKGAEHEPLVTRLRQVFPHSVVLQSDICRRELVLEIEGVAVLAKR